MSKSETIAMFQNLLDQETFLKTHILCALSYLWNEEYTELFR